MNFDDAAATLINAMPGRYLLEDGDTNMRQLGHDASLMVGQLNHEARLACQKAEEASEASEPVGEPEKPGCAHEECPRLVAADSRGFYESHCEAHLIEVLRDQIATLSPWDLDIQRDGDTIKMIEHRIMNGDDLPHEQGRWLLHKLARTAQDLHNWRRDARRPRADNPWVP